MENLEKEQIPQMQQRCETDSQMAEPMLQENAQTCDVRAYAEQKEQPADSAPYATFYAGQVTYQPPHTNHQPEHTPQQQPWQAWQTPVQPVKPRKEMKAGKILRGILSWVLTVALVVAGCAVTANICNRYWREQNALLLQNMHDKISALQQQIDDKQSGVESGGTLAPGQTMTAAQIYQENVASVVCITTNKGSGTGFVITENGYIVTNHHVIEGATKITVSLSDGTRYAAELVGSDSTNDVALIKARAVGLDPVTLGSSSAMQVGDQVVAIGNALGELSSTLTVGYISGMDRDISTDGTVINMIQTDAAINSGNSGGPLFNAKGEVIGITTAKYSGTTSSGATIEGISFAIPLDDVWDMIEDLRDFGYIKSAYLGVMVWEVDASVAETYNLPQGVYVEEVTFDSCAEKAGVRAKDIIVELGGYTVRTLNDLGRALRAYEAGQMVTIVVWRAGQQVVLNITLDEKPVQ